MNKVVSILMLVTLSVWLAVFNIDNNLQIIACDVGQGDAILIQQKSFQILVDGGPNNKVLNCLGKHLPFWDRKIEVVILTHPDLDHYGGLVDLLKNYKIENFFTNGYTSSSQEYQVLEKEVGGKGLGGRYLKSGMVIRYDLIHLDILNPEDNNQEPINNNQTDGDNNQSIVILLNYGQFKALLTGDAEQEVSDRLSKLQKIQNIDYIKVNHHGSKNGMTENLLKVTNPAIAVISAGVKNRYGHPSAEILEMLNKYGVKILRTDEMGDVVVKTDGKSLAY